MASLARLLQNRPASCLYQKINDPTSKGVFLLAQLSTSAQNLSPPTPPPAPQSHDQKKWKWSSLFLFIPGAITFGLGTWQLFRRQEKIEELEFKKKRLQMEPTNLNSMSSLLPGPGDLGSLEFRRVVCEGVYDESKSVFVGPRSRSISGLVENGYYVLTPLLLRKEPGSVQLSVLVNRGWVPRSWRNKFLENSAEITQSSITKVDDAEHKHEPWWKFWTKGAAVSKDLKHHNIELVKVLGVIRGSEKPSIYVPANEPSTGQWFYVDVPAIVQHLGLPESTIYVEEINEDVNPSKPYPIPKELNSLISHSVMPRDHLNYVFTWYSLSAAVTFMAIKRTLPKKSQR
ncbi:Surfeit locus protein 1 [Nymphaea thermarum]|nr:Surfeit locus protein 1 [Nymphaea thermarum]